MALIPLPNNQLAIVDDEDYETLKGYKWFVSNHGYVHRTQYLKGRNTTVSMHRTVNKTPKGLETDHINQNKLDNRKANLRTCTTQENARNKGIYSNNTSGYKGVMWYKPYSKWVARISNGVKTIHLGYFTDPIEASQAYQKAKLTIHGSTK